MIKRFIVGLALLVVTSVAYADVCKAYTTGNGYARYLPTTAKLLTSAPDGGVVLPNNVTGAIMFVNTAPIRFRTDGTTPTAAEGVQVPAGTAIIFDANSASQLKTFQFIQVTSGAEVTISYCSGTGN